MRAIVYVTLKPAVLDPQGRAVHRTLARLGFAEVAGVRVGKYIEVDLGGSPGGSLTADAARERVEAMCEALLANPVIEDYRVEIVE